MTDEEKISLIGLMIGDYPGTPYYPMFTEDQYRQFLLLTNGDVRKAAIQAAISMLMQLSGESNREVIGELSVSSNIAASYQKSLELLIETSGKVPPAALMPWFAGMDTCDKNKLLDFSLCDKGVYPWHKTGEPDCRSGC